jgi:hypothetical protein
MFINSSEGKNHLIKNKFNIQEDTKNKTSVQTIKESNTLDNKHRTMVKKFQNQKGNLIELNKELENLNNKLNELEKIKDVLLKEDKTGCIFLLIFWTGIPLILSFIDFLRLIMTLIRYRSINTNKEVNIIFIDKRFLKHYC